MKFQSIIINTKNRESSLDEINKILKNFGISEKISSFNSLIITKSEAKNSIGIKELEGLTEWAYTRSDQMKFIAIFDADKLTEEAQNSLLKIVEEPPESLQLVLIASNVSQILVTLQSRCIVINAVSSESKNSQIDLKAFIKSDYLERSKIIDKITQNEDFGRAELEEFLSDLLKELFNLKELEKTEFVKKAFKANRRGTNIKLIMDYLNINFN